ncbi:MAG: methylated-DNA--[protein]-cysteine S-methyltransferase [Melioribacteraceae bacterium]|nr:methylated-DNA--[protein]-cysteine S-methyltransferase [Melioribacteraceae bacterium]MCF8356824.1 methylated-DNA--[protein]-cysteine S-methyltransferase [Melioribacteraceae bacterium]MCF8396193.1 methylated-DNA--[protein]-cysteine S-methyltransferase [Melioribacteraceae bacterium]MCF8421137.1 methylated-DNA--[protein]-cysteine S-methyltransferase [Melioribacteraceae bacterium]
MNKIYKSFYKSDIGYLDITATGDGIRSIEFSDLMPVNGFEVNHHIEKCLKQLHEYFKGRRKRFTVDLDLDGTTFQKRVWSELLVIPYGKTLTYLDIAMALGDMKSIRAVGTANGRNKIPIIIPCHRVIGTDGSLTGYAGGIWRKKWLLDHEKDYSSVEKQLELF